MASVFRSVHHPGDTPSGVVYTRALAGPIGACTVPLMIGATTSALLQQSVWPFLVWGLPLAVLCATGWAHFTLTRQIAELHLRAGQAALRSVWDVMRDRSAEWHALHNVKTTAAGVELSIGWAAYELRRVDWAQFPQMQAQNEEAFRADRPTQSAPPA